MIQKKTDKHYTVSTIDVAELLPLVRKEVKSLTEELAEDKRVKDELDKFISLIRKHSKKQVHHIGQERSFNKHVDRLIFKDDGFVEILAESPLVINGYFLDKRSAIHFHKALKKTIRKLISKNEEAERLKKFFIESIKIESPKEQIVTFDKWAKMHRIGLHSTLVFTIVAFILVLMFEATTTTIEFINSEILKFNIHKLVFVIANSLFVAIFFEPIKLKVSDYIEKVIKKAGAA